MWYVSVPEGGRSQPPIARSAGGRTRIDGEAGGDGGRQIRTAADFGPVATCDIEDNAVSDCIVPLMSRVSLTHKGVERERSRQNPISGRGSEDTRTQVALVRTDSRQREVAFDRLCSN